MYLDINTLEISGGGSNDAVAASKRKVNISNVSQSGSNININLVTEHTPILISGYSPPNISTGEIGDVYLDCKALLLYGAKTEGGWPDPVSIKGEDAPKISQPKDGVSIANITQSNNDVVIKLSDGKSYNLSLPVPKNGIDGKGIKAASLVDKSIRIAYSDGTYDDINIPIPTVRNGADARQIEMNASDTHIQWRREGDALWRDICEIPKGKKFYGSGGGRSIASIREIAREEIAAGGGGGAVDSVNGQTGVVVLDADDIGAVSNIPLPGAVTYTGEQITEIALTGGNTYTIAYNLDGTIDTVADGTYTRTFSYDGNGRIDSWGVV